MHGSIWHMKGDPDELLRSYERMLTELPAQNMRLHLCMRAPDGIVIVDTCPSQDVFDAFFAGEGFRALRMRYGLPDPESVEDFPVHTAFIDGARTA